jgi:hypothetical protein
MHSPPTCFCAQREPIRYRDGMTRRFGSAPVWGYVCCMGLVGCAAQAARGRVIVAVEHAQYAAALHEVQDAAALHEVQAEGTTRELSHVFAESLLFQAARSADAQRSQNAFAELAGLGTRARPLLERLAEPDEPSLPRARALRLELALGESAARRKLRKLLADHDPEVADQALAALEVEHDWAQLQTALSAPREQRRSLALQVVAAATPFAGAVPELARVSALDPVPALRSSALYALANYGARAQAAFEQALHDPDDEVRVVAFQAYAHALPDAAADYLDQQLGAAANVESISAAAALLRMRPPRETVRAYAMLLSGLHASESGLRARTALLLRGLPASAWQSSDVRAQLQIERVPEVQLALALVLGANQPEVHAKLQALMQGEGMPALQAALELSHPEHAARVNPIDDAAAQTRLVAFAASPSMLLRVSAARGLHGDARGLAALVRLLADADPRVRVAAAGAVLRL